MKSQASKTFGFSPVGFVVVIGVGLALYFTGGFSWASKRFGFDTFLAGSHSVRDTPEIVPTRSIASILAELDSYSLNTDPDKPPTVKGYTDEELQGLPTEKAKELMNGALQSLMSSQEGRSRLFTLGRIIYFNPKLADDRETAINCFRHAADEGSIAAKAYFAVYAPDKLTVMQSLKVLDDAAAEGFSPAVEMKTQTEKKIDDYLDEQVGHPADKQIPGGGGTVEDEVLASRDLKAVLQLVDTYRAYAERPGASPRFLFGLGRALLKKKKNPEAEELLQKAAKNGAALANVYLIQLPKYKEDFLSQVIFLRKAVSAGYTEAVPDLNNAIQELKHRRFNLDEFSNPRLISALLHHEVTSLLESGVQITARTDRGPLAFTSPALVLDYLTIIAEEFEKIDPRFIAGAEWSFIPVGGVGPMGRMKVTTGSASWDLLGLSTKATAARVIPNPKLSFAAQLADIAPSLYNLYGDKSAISKLVFAQVEGQARKDAQLLVTYNHAGTTEPVKEVYSSIVEFITQYH